MQAQHDGLLFAGKFEHLEMAYVIGTFDMPLELQQCFGFDLFGQFKTVDFQIAIICDNFESIVAEPKAISV